MRSRTDRGLRKSWGEGVMLGGVGDSTPATLSAGGRGWKPLGAALLEVGERKARLGVRKGGGGVMAAGEGVAVLPWSGEAPAERLMDDTGAWIGSWSGDREGSERVRWSWGLGGCGTGRETQDDPAEEERREPRTSSKVKGGALNWSDGRRGGVRLGELLRDWGEWKVLRCC